MLVGPAATRTSGGRHRYASHQHAVVVIPTSTKITVEGLMVLLVYVDKAVKVVEPG